LTFKGNSQYQQNLEATEGGSISMVSNCSGDKKKLQPPPKATAYFNVFLWH
jgi:hypothetical protein